MDIFDKLLSVGEENMNVDDGYLTKMNTPISSKVDRISVTDKSQDNGMYIFLINIIHLPIIYIIV